MKFFSELGSCLGGATLAPTAETTTSTVNPRQQREAGRLGRGGNGHAAVAPGGTRKGKPTTTRHWKPSLSMISEDTIVASDMRRREVGGSDDQISAKVKAKSRAKAKPTYYGEDYW